MWGAALHTRRVCALLAVVAAVIAATSHDTASYAAVSPVPTTPTIRSADATASSIKLVWNASTDDVAVVGYGVYLNGALVRSVPRLWYAFGGLTCGTTYSLGVDAYDAAGNRSAKATLSVKTTACTGAPPAADTTPPSVPDGMTQTGATQTTLSLSWTPSADNVGVAGYRVYKNNALAATVTSTSFTFAGLSCGTTYTIGLTAFDAAGNASNVAFAQGPMSTAPCSSADTTPPSAPTGLATSAISATSITLSWNASSDNVGVAGYGRYRNGVLLANASGTSQTFSGLACGTTYTLAVDAYDAAGNRSAKTTLAATTSACADTTPPSMPTGLSTSAISATSITLSWNAATDNVGVTGYGRYRNGTLLSSAAGTSYTFSGLSCGTAYTLAVDAYDAAGNRSTKASVTASTSACTDTVAPSVPDNMAQTGATQTSISLSWSPSTDNVGVTGYRLYKENVLTAAVAATSYTFTGLSCGTTYLIGLTAIDAAGNESNVLFAQGPLSTAACAGDATAPSVPAGLATSAVGQTSVTLNWAASSDNVGVTGYGRYLNGTLLSSGSGTSFTFTGLTCGTTYAFGVDAYDAAGNRSARASVNATTAACSAPPSGSAALFVSPSGSDTAACTQSAPCRSFSRAYAAAAPGAIVEVAGGTYGAQAINPDASKTSAADVVFRPAAGATVQVGGLNVYGSHVEFQGMTFTAFPYWRTWKTADDVTFRNDSAPKFAILGSSNVTVIGGNYGPNDNGSNDIAPESPTDTKVPTNIVIDGVTIHDFRQTDGSAHVDCIHTWGLNGLVVRRSTFYNCEHFDILFTKDSVVGTPTNVTIENNFFDCCRSGYYSVYLGDQHGESYSNYLIRNNSSNKAMGIGTSNAQTVANIRFYGNIAPSFDGCGLPGVTVDYNVWYSGSKCGTNDRVAASGFVNAAAHDFHLVGTAAAIDRGNPASAPGTDYDGDARPLGAAVDAGADEYASGALPAADAQAPTPPTGLGAVTTQTAVTLSWTPSTDNVGVAGYGVYRNGASAGSTTGTTYTVSGLTCGTSYTFSVDATDAAGNRSAMASVTAATSACVTPTPTPSPSSSGAVYLAPTGSDSNACTQAAPCKSFDRGYHVAQPGQAVEVAGGTYPGQTITADASKATASSDVTIRPAAGATVTVGGEIRLTGAKHLELRDIRADDWYAGSPDPAASTTSFVTLRNLDVNDFFVTGNVSDLKVLGGDVGPVTNLNTEVKACTGCSQPPRNLTFDGVYFHDFVRTDPTVHMECFHVMAADGLVVRNSRFRKCAIMDILLSQYGGFVTTNVTIENNFFDNPTAGGSYAFYAEATLGRALQNIIIRNNSSLATMFVDNTAGASNVKFVSNIGPRAPYHCYSGIGFEYNVWDGAACSATDLNAPSGFRDATNFDLHLNTSAAAVNRGSVTGSSSVDIDGQSRPLGLAPDAGADEAG